MRWSASEVRYMEEHAEEGADAIARALGRSPSSVRTQASRLGISVRRFWKCPRCGMRSSKPPAGKTGWCRACTMEARRKVIAEQIRDMEAEARREEDARRERQRLYSKKSRVKKKCMQQRMQQGHLPAITEEGDRR